MYSVKEETLQNGLKVLLVDTKAKDITVQMWYRTGSVNDPEGKKGLSHFVEHLTFWPDHWDRIKKINGFSEAFTSEDFTVYNNCVKKENLQEVLKLEASRMETIDIGYNGFVIETDRVLEEIYINTGCNIRGKLFEGHPYQSQVLGTFQDIENMDMFDIMGYHQKWYMPNNSTIIVQGNCYGTLELIKKVFSVIKPGTLPVETPKTVLNTGLIENKNDSKPFCMEFYHTPLITDVESICFHLIEVIQNRFLNIFKKVGMLNKFTHHNSFSTFVTVGSDRAKALNRINKFICEITNISEGEIKRAKKTIYNEHLDFKNPRKAHDSMLCFDTISNGLDEWRDKMLYMEYISKTLINDVVEKYLNFGNCFRVFTT